MALSTRVNSDSLCSSLTNCLFLLAFEARMSLASEFVQTRGTHFVLDNSLFLFNGFNGYWMMQVATQPSERYLLVSMMKTSFKALDFVVSEAAKNKVHLILSLVNNYQDFGWRSQYVDWARNAGVQTSSDDDFYTNVVVKHYYKNHVKAWVQEMASYVNPFTTNTCWKYRLKDSMETQLLIRKQYNQAYQVGTNFIRSNLIKEIDFTTIHAYPDAWLSAQGDDAQMAFLRKGFSLASRDSFLNAIYSNIYSLARSGGIGGGLVFQLVAEGMESYSDGYEIDLFQTPSTSSIISQQSRQMTALEHKISRP
ncbi:UNVERIFIED_CONTAM: Mannan endo-1,4-beta-mannosidase 2 [Sesamum angustifolium]|uniref:Mannan endo-1,4-beta-mannosidase 2 n=1 Tax=Sesamum angustifolium TaxID=2727405 RepID=A0AAW2QB71_9LAMI